MPIERTMNTTTILCSLVVFVILQHYQITEAHGYESKQNITAAGCVHNGSIFANRSFVPTVEPCLNCKCINANLICALRVCPEQPIPPPRGCIVVQKRDTCCPYLTCTKYHTDYATDDKHRKIITYDRKWYEQNIRNRIFSPNTLLRRIDDGTPSDGDQHQEQPEFSNNNQMCVHNGTVYRSGSAMSTSSLCSYCYCIGGKQKCVKPKCLLPDKGCEPILIDTSCCPIRYDCSGNGTIKAQYRTKSHRRRSENMHYLRMTSRMQRSRGCLVDSSFYPEGHKLPANQTNPCEICFCIGGSKRCTPKKCAPVIRNCKPIIPDGQCCPSSYDCDHKPNMPTGRGITARQYDFFSLLFGEEDKENATSLWDDESETESIDGKFETTSEKSFLDAIRDGLSLIEAGNNNNNNSAGASISSDLATPATAPANVGDDDDEEEISIIDFLLNGENIFSSTTAKPLQTVTVAASNSGNAASTNSPMHIKTIIPDEVKNGKMKFALLPMSLYNMVKDDGSIIFDPNNATEILARTPIADINAEAFETTTDATTDEISTTYVVSTDGDEYKTTSSSADTTNSATDQSIASSEIDSTSTVETMVAEMTTIASIESREDVDQITATNDNEFLNVTEVNRGEAEILVTTNGPIVLTEQTTIAVAVNDTAPKYASTSIELETSASTIDTIKTITETTNHLTTVRPSSPVVIDSNPSILETDLNYDYSEPTLPPSLPNLKIIPFLPTDAVKHVESFDLRKVNYISSNNNYYLSHSNPYSGETSSPSHSNTNYSPFNGKPAATDKYPVYHGQVQLAGDRLDYDGYNNKKDENNLPNIEYSNVYSVSGTPASHNVVNAGAPFVHGGIDSKLEFDTFNHKVESKPPPKNGVATTTVKNLLNINRFETPYNDLFHVPRPRPTTNPRPTDNFDYEPYKYGDDTYLAQYQRQPDFDDDYAILNVPPVVHALGQQEGAAPPKPFINYAGKNNFIPPLKTEGGFVPKKPTNENYIPLHVNDYHQVVIKQMENRTAEDNESPISIESILKSLNGTNNAIDRQPNANQTMMDFEKNIISITTDASYQAMPDYPNAFLAVDLSENSVKPNVNKSKTNETNSTLNKQSLFVLNGPFNREPLDEIDSDEDNDSGKEPSGVDFFSNLYGFIFKDDEPIRSTTSPTIVSTTTTVRRSPPTSATTSSPTKIHQRKNETGAGATAAAAAAAPPSQIQNNTIPLKLITILNNTKKESPTKSEIPQRKNNKIIDPTNEPLYEGTQMPTTTPIQFALTKTASDKAENLTALRNILLATLSHSSSNDDGKSPFFLQRPINKSSPTFSGNADFPAINSIESKHSLQSNPIRSEFDFSIPELNKNQQTDLSSDGYQMLPHVDLHKLNEATVAMHQTQGETKVFTPPAKDPAGLLKLAGCNIYGRMYRVGRIIAELSGPCLECRCTEVGVSCTPLNC